MTSSPGSHLPVFGRLERLALLLLRGADARAFLHGQLTCDVNALPPGHCQHGGYCTAKGRLLATFLVWQRDDAFHLLLAAGQREVTQKQLSKFILRSRVVVADASADHVCIGLSGDGAAEVVGRVFGTAPAAPYDVQHVIDASIVTLPAERHLLVIPAVRAQAMEDALATLASRAPSDAWEWQDIRAGVPVITPRTQEEFVPQMVNLDLLGGVSFTKGCYPGQEIVARMHYLGRLKQRMYLVHIAVDTAPQAGDKVYSARFGDQACGMVVRAAAAPGGGHDALAVIQIGEAQDGKVHLGTADGPLLQFLELPYPITVS